MKEELEIHVDELPQAIVMRLKGNVGISGSRVLELQLTRLVARRPGLAILDLSECLMLTSLAMGQIITTHRSITRSGGKLRLAARQPLVLDSLKHAHLEAILPIFNTVEEALATQT